MNIEWGSINNDLCKSDAVIMAHNFAHQIGEPVYAVETKWGWIATDRVLQPNVSYMHYFEWFRKNSGDLPILAFA